MKRTTLAFLLLAGVAGNSEAQNSLVGKKDVKTWSITLGGGLMLARTDIKQFDWYPVGSYNNERRFGFYGALTKSISPVLAFQGQLNKGNLSGTKRKMNQYFDADVLDASLNLVVNLKNLFHVNAGKKNKFSYSLVAGAGISQFKTKLKVLDGTTKNSTVFSYGYGEFGGPKAPTRESFINTGFNFRYNINKEFDLGLDIMHKTLNSDKLDAYVKDDKDKYIISALTLTYHMGKKEKVPFERKDPTNIMYEQLMSLQSKVDSLTKDTDGDGVPDLYDKDNKTPDNVIANTKGQANDADNDKVPDAVDKEPFSNKGVTVNAMGQELDDDEDGVPNSKDIEPNTPKGNMVNFQGKTIEVKVAQEVKEDKFNFDNQPKNIPNEKHVNMNTGTTSATSSGVAAVNSVPVYFSTDNAAVSEKYVENLAQIALYMKVNPTVRLRITGHTDAAASSDYNYRLGLKRADVVKQYLVRNFKVKTDRILTASKGETELLSPTIDSVNRRVEVDILR